jgi:putative ABC transport system substrate-binding protein
MSKKVICVALGAMLLAFSFPAHAQQPTKVPRLGYISSGDPASESTRAEAIRLALRERGYIEGQNITFEYRYAEGKRDRFPELAAELVRLKVDIIVVAGGSIWVRAAKNATKTIPIVMVDSGRDPVEAGLVESLARPGGNVTGITLLVGELGGKRLELRSGSQSCPCRRSLQSGHSAQCTRGERGSPGRGASVRVDYSVLGGTQCGRFR